MNRIDWSLDGERLLTCVAGTLRTHVLDGASAILDGPDLLDARWRDDAIVAIDTHGVRRWYRDGAIETAGDPLRSLSLAAIATTADEAAVIDPEYVSVLTFQGDTRWRLYTYEHDLSLDDRTSIAISHDGTLVAIGYETRATYYRKEGRGWIVVDTGTKRVLDRGWTEIRGRRLAALALAFDGKCKRIVFGVPEPVTFMGAMRLGKDDRYVRMHAGGARAVALDDRGVLAAYAYGTGERRLRVDYLEPGVKGGSAIAILDTLWIDPALDDIVAIAFDRKSRRIACCDAAGRVDVVPVP